MPQDLSRRQMPGIKMPPEFGNGKPIQHPKTNGVGDGAKGIVLTTKISPKIPRIALTIFDMWVRFFSQRLSLETSPGLEMSAETSNP